MRARVLNLFRTGRVTFGLKQAIIVAFLAIAVSLVGALIRSGRAIGTNPGLWFASSPEL